VVIVLVKSVIEGSRGDLPLTERQSCCYVHMVHWHIVMLKCSF